MKLLLTAALILLGSRISVAQLDETIPADVKLPAESESPPPLEAPKESKYAKAISDLQSVVNEGRGIGNLEGWRQARGLVQFPTEGPNHSEGFCGSNHYLQKEPAFDKEGYPTDNYAKPTTACALMATLQEWKKDYCRDPEAGCRVFWGDIAHTTYTKKTGRIWPHRTHGTGSCIDIRPMRKGKAEDKGLSYGLSEYDRDMTEKFIKLAYKNGANLIYFNDKKIQCSRMARHSDHMHVCFDETQATKDLCKNFKYDPAVCEGN